MYYARRRSNSEQLRAATTTSGNLIHRVTCVVTFTVAFTGSLYSFAFFLKISFLSRRICLSCELSDASDARVQQRGHYRNHFIQSVILLGNDSWKRICIFYIRNIVYPYVRAGVARCASVREGVIRARVSLAFNHGLLEKYKSFSRRFSLKTALSCSKETIWPKASRTYAWARVRVRWKRNIPWYVYVFLGYV